MDNCLSLIKRKKINNNLAIYFIIFIILLFNMNNIDYFKTKTKKIIVCNRIS